MTKKKGKKKVAAAEEAGPAGRSEQEEGIMTGPAGDVGETGDTGEAESEQAEGVAPAAGESDWLREKEELLDRIKRKQADIDNLRRIGRQEQAEAREYSLHEFLSRLLPVLDNLERALEAARATGDVPGSHLEGLEMIHRQLLQLLEHEDVKEIEAVGCAFDPNCHHAVMQVESDDHEPGSVVEELQKGYFHRRRVLRPSMVKVCAD